MFDRGNEKWHKRHLRLALRHFLALKDHSPPDIYEDITKLVD
jgi:hypothetical protein